MDLRSTKTKSTSYFPEGWGFYYVNHSHTFDKSLCTCHVGQHTDPGITQTGFFLTFHIGFPQSDPTGKGDAPNVIRANGDLYHRDAHVRKSPTLHRKSITAHLPSKRQNLFLLCKGCLFVFYFVTKSTRIINLENPNNSRVRNFYHGLESIWIWLPVCLLFIIYELECLFFLLEKLSHRRHVTSTWYILCWSAGGLPKGNA